MSPLEAHSLMQATAPMLRGGLDLLVRPAGHPRQHAAPLFPRPHGLDIDPEELAEDRLADSQRCAEMLDRFGTKGLQRGG